LWALSTPTGLLGKADAIGYAVCHRIDLRSFHLGERALPLCARCTGLYLGAALSLAFFQISGRQGAGGYPSRPLLVVLGLFGLAFAVDAGNSYLSFFPQLPRLYAPRNELRLATGLLAGVTMGSLVYPAFQQTAWSEWRSERALRGGRDLAVILAMAAALYLAVVSENPLILYPLALASAVSVIGLLSVVYTVLALSVFRRENRVTSWRGLGLPAAAGLTLALIQIGVLDWGRFALTGTWGGFQF
jgi:uncharacterized membrane protein